MYSELFLFSTTCTSCLLMWLVQLFAALMLGVWAGYLIWGKYKKTVNGLQTDVKAYQAKLNDRDTEYASLKYAHDELDKDNKAMRSTVSTAEGNNAALQAALDRCRKESAAAAAAALGAGGIALGNTTTEPEADLSAASEPLTGYAAYGGYFATDNLQIIEGIGPKISKVLTAAGVDNWSKLAAKSVSELRDILTKGGISNKINDPKTWPEQARLAKEGEWEELVKYQKFLDTGTENKGDFETPAKVEKLYLKAIGFAGAKSDDLKIVEGIGPKIEELLKNAGIGDWKALATAKKERLQAILDAAGSRYKLANPGTWAKQAELADAGKWQELKEYQDYLSGGKELS